MSVENVLHYRCLCEQYHDSAPRSRMEEALHEEMLTVWQRELTPKEREDVSSGKAAAVQARSHDG